MKAVLTANVRDVIYHLYLILELFESLEHFCHNAGTGLERIQVCLFFNNRFFSLSPSIAAGLWQTLEGFSHNLPPHKSVCSH